MWRENELWTDYIRSIIYAKLALKQWKQKQKQIHVAPTSETLTRLYTFFKHRESGFYVCIIVCAMRYPLFHSLPQVESRLLHKYILYTYC